MLLFVKLHYIAFYHISLHYIELHDMKININNCIYIKIQNTSLKIHYSTVHCISFHYIALHRYAPYGFACTSICLFVCPRIYPVHYPTPSTHNIPRIAFHLPGCVWDLLWITWCHAQVSIEWFGVRWSWKEHIVWATKKTPLVGGFR